MPLQHHDQLRDHHLRLQKRSKIGGRTTLSQIRRYRAKLWWYFEKTWVSPETGGKPRMISPRSFTSSACEDPSSLSESRPNEEYIHDKSQFWKSIGRSAGLFILHGMSGANKVACWRGGQLGKCRCGATYHHRLSRQPDPGSAQRQNSRANTAAASKVAGSGDSR